MSTDLTRPHFSFYPPFPNLSPFVSYFHQQCLQLLSHTVVYMDLRKTVMRLYQTNKTFELYNLFQSRVLQGIVDTPSYIRDIKLNDNLCGMKVEMMANVEATQLLYDGGE